MSETGSAATTDEGVFEVLEADVGGLVRLLVRDVSKSEPDEVVFGDFLDGEFGEELVLLFGLVQHLDLSVELVHLEVVFVVSCVLLGLETRDVFGVLESG